MTNRYHLPVVVTTSDNLTRTEAAEYVERILSNLEETDEIYRTYIEGGGIDDGDAERLMDMLNRVEDEDIDAALDALDVVTEDSEE